MLFTKTDYLGVCIISVFGMIIFHYTAAFCIIFRAIRIHSVMDLEKRYLDQIYKLEQNENLDDEENRLKMVYFPLL